MDESKCSHLFWTQGIQNCRGLQGWPTVFSHFWQSCGAEGQLGRQARCNLGMIALHFAGDWNVWCIQISLSWNYSSLHGLVLSLLFRPPKKAVVSDGNPHIFQTRKLINGKFGLFLKITFWLTSHKAKAKIEVTVVFKAHVLDVFSLSWVCLLYCPCHVMALTVGAFLSKSSFAPPFQGGMPGGKLHALKMYSPHFKIRKIRGFLK